jgi:hypothetical protein
MSHTKPSVPRVLKAAGTSPAEAAVAIVITADHVYLPVDESGNVGTTWTASDVSTSRILKRTRLKVPADLARFLSNRNQAEILTPTVEDKSSVAPTLSSFAKASEDKSSVAPTGA